MLLFFSVKENNSLVDSICGHILNMPRCHDLKTSLTLLATVIYPKAQADVQMTNLASWSVPSLLKDCYEV